MLEIEAIYENGILKPTQPLALEEQQKVHLIVRTKCSRIRQSAGLISWKGSAGELERIALEPEFGIEESP
jgi:predicted DNA-binding antitoxin AbrB/MazE fold protein